MRSHCAIIRGLRDVKYLLQKGTRLLELLWFQLALSRSPHLHCQLILLSSWSAGKHKVNPEAELPSTLRLELDRA